MDFSENSPGCDVPELSEITVRRSSRCRRIGVKIKNDRSIELTAPENTPEKVLLETYAKFKPWLASQLEKLAGLPEEDQAYKFEFKVGGRFFFCGKSYELQKAEKSGASVITLHEDCLLTPSEMPGSIKLMLEAFYRRHARRLGTGSGRIIQINHGLITFPAPASFSTIVYILVTPPTANCSVRP